MQLGSPLYFPRSGQFHINTEYNIIQYEIYLIKKHIIFLMTILMRNNYLLDPANW